ncbi:MAG: nucleotidyl transferase AbiEii/AbiGii toxin family protein [Lachnospiraceae bacterium]|nr:nucleotidyl transferase AbiEii/AbiGii toxin family protein [Lachnospiraceae bacterium]
MAVKEIKDMGASVLTLIKKQSKETGINYQSCLQLLAQEEFLRKLEQSNYADNLILKGGMFLYTITNFAGRPTMDIDFLMCRISNDIAGMEQIMRIICEVNTGNDFITMEVLGTMEITPEKD